MTALSDFHPTDAALDAGVAAWFGLTKVESGQDFIRKRMAAAVAAVVKQTLPNEPTAERLLSYLEFIDQVGGAPMDATPEQKSRIERAAEAARPCAPAGVLPDPERAA